MKQYKDMTNTEIIEKISYANCPVKCVECESMCDLVTVKKCRENLSAKMDRWEKVTFDEKYIGSENTTLYFTAPKEMLAEFGYNYPEAVSTEVSLEYTNISDIVASISPTNTEGEDYDWNQIELADAEIELLLNLAGLKAEDLMVHKVILRSACAQIDCLKDKLGEVLVDAFSEEDNSGYEMAKGVMSTLESCSTQKEFDAANNMLMAICGYSIESLVERIRERDEQGFSWESC